MGIPARLAAYFFACGDGIEFGTSGSRDMSEDREWASKVLFLAGFGRRAVPALSGPHCEVDADYGATLVRSGATTIDPTPELEKRSGPDADIQLRQEA